MFAAYFPYLRGVIKGEAHPHMFTWLIWGLTEGSAATLAWIGGAGLGALPMTVATCLVLTVFCFSLRGGKKNVTKSDIGILMAALLAICIWFFMDNPAVAIVMLASIDVCGYIPTFRKSYRRPWREVALSWGAFVVADTFALMALEAYNLLTMTYIGAILFANFSLLVFLLIRRRYITEPVVEEVLV